MFSIFFPERSEVPSPMGKVTWRYFWPVLGAALVMRMILAYYGDYVLHPDEAYQYFEPAHRLVYGYGFIPWEYIYGIRSWFIPLCMAAIMWVGQFFGADEPHLYIPLLETVFCLISLTLPVGMYRLTQLLWNETAAVVAFLIGCFWHHFVFVAHKPMPSILAAYTLIWMAVWMLRPAGVGRLILFGAISSLTLVLRFQLLPVVGLLNLVALARLKWAVWPVILGNVIVIVAAGLLDQVFWGTFLSSYIDNFALNFLYDISSTFGVHEFLFYMKRLGVESGALVIPALLGIAVLTPRFWPVVVALVVGAAAFHVPAHKELRFMFWLLPFILIAAAIASAVLHDKLPDILTARSFVPKAFVLWAFGISLWYIAHYANVIQHKQWDRDMRALTRQLAQVETVNGLDVRTQAIPWGGPVNYHTLHHPVPIYIANHMREPDQAERRYRRGHVSHIIDDHTLPDPEGFEQIGREGPFRLWQNTQPTQAVGLEAFDLRGPIPTPIPDDFESFGKRTPVMIDGPPPRNR